MYSAAVYSWTCSAVLGLCALVVYLMKRQRFSSVRKKKPGIFLRAHVHKQL